MKIEKMCSKQDIVSNLKKAANYSKLEHLRKLAEYIQQEFELENLKEGLTIDNYDIKIGNGQYQIVKLKSQYDSEKNIWKKVEETVIEQIPLEAVEQIEL